MSSRKLLPLGQAARLLQVPAYWLQKEAIAKRVPCVKISRAILFDIAAVKRVFLERNLANEG